MGVKKTIVLDALLAVAFLVSLVPDVTTVAGHEWLGLVVAAAFLVHTAAHLRATGERSALRTANLVVDALSLVVLAVTTVSGLGISATVLQTFGLFADGYFFWSPLHALSAKVLLALAVVHVALHARFIAGVLRTMRTHRNGAVAQER